MSNNIVLATIGMRDLQYVYKDSLGDRYRTAIHSIEDYTDFLNKCYLLPYRDYEEQELKSIAHSQVDGVTIPMLQKAFEFAKYKGAKQIDKLILLPTKRDTLAEILDSLPAKINDSEHRDSVARYIKDNKILDYAKKDYSYQSAVKIKHLLSTQSDQIPLHLSEIDVLPLGEYGFLGKLFSSPDEISTADLDRADINRSDFFDFELIEALKPYLSELEGANIYLASFSGGLPGMQKSLSKVLQSLLVSPVLIPVPISEERGFISLQDPQDSFLSQHKQMSQCAMEMDWDTVGYLLKEISQEKPDYFTAETEEELGHLIKTIFNIQKDDKSWFSNFFVLILRALYKHDYNNLVIWLKCIEEAAWFAVLKLPENEEKNGYKFTPDHKINDYQKQNVLLFNPQFFIPARYTDVKEYLRSGNSIKYLKEYEGLFFDTRKVYNNNNNDRYSHNKVYGRIVTRRNQLVHYGKPVQKDDGMISSLLKYIGTSTEDLNKAIFALKSSDWQTVSEFEKNLLISSPFFSVLKKIAGITDPEWLPIERVSIKDYIQIIHDLSKQ
ncbi:MAG: hypothetical protein LHW41_05615 [Candidatus Cloacimonetes bacterium]|jgi:hypothetical protein|nr:hypothetical protein [Candidatus Cloacimonadota bacterium]